MFIYKVNIQIKTERENEWFHWMSVKHIPDVLNTEHFLDFNFYKLNPNGKVPDPGFSMYEIQYICNNEEDYLKYKAGDAELLQKEHEVKFGGSYKATRETYFDVTKKTVQEVV